MRTIRVGSVEHVWGRITEDTGADLTTATVQLRVIDPAEVVGDWATPDDEERPSVSVIRAAVLITGAALGVHRLQAKVTDNPEVPILELGMFQVIPAV